MMFIITRLGGHMAIIVFASPKGGAGKTTSAFVLATELSNRGMNVTIIDADPNHPIADWVNRRGTTNHLTVVSNNDEETILNDIDKANQSSDFTIVDLEGTANLSVAYSISRADLVIVPSQRSTLDAGEAAKAISLVKTQSNVIGREIKAALLLTRTSQAIRTKGLKRMMDSLTNNKIDTFITELHERESFKAIFDHTNTLAQLTPTQVGGLEKARQNAAEFAAEALQKLQNIAQDKPKEVA